MAELSLIVSILAVALALAGYLLNRQALKAEERDRARHLSLVEQELTQGKQALGLEREARAEEIRLLRAQVQGEEEDRLRRRAATLTAAPLRSRRGGAENEWEWDFKLTNVGAAAARHIEVSLLDANSNPLGRPTELWGGVLLSEQSEEITLRLPLTVLERTERVLQVFFWTDDTGAQQYTSKVTSSSQGNDVGRCGVRHGGIPKAVFRGSAHLAEPQLTTRLPHGRRETHRASIRPTSVAWLSGKR